MDHPTSYDDDVYAWAYEQVAILRDLAASRRDLPNALDVEHICEEIEGVARTDLREAESFMRLVLLHLLKIASVPDAPSVDHWRDEVLVFQSDFQTVVTPSILQKIDTGRVWRLAVRLATSQLAREGDQILGGLPVECPILPADLAGQPFDLGVALDRIVTSTELGRP
ncbi:DUF29 domain-containing protein [Enterovirga aerilata]|uniref:DUF29 domain-containing protein n=1 Tax=Enterovirga aerilata TaxID=2730920 RepID=A0A849I748_9HYPH|nr:DUF29 domain-containing protein [Enterovirga sp. DB1703]NNM71910.1 DUF29 domain-containing protein [Enterovirga sp. DB1703]